MRLSAILIVLAFALWTCSQQEREQSRNPKPKQEQEKILLRTNNKEGYIIKDSRATVERYLIDYKRHQKELGSIKVPSHISVGESLNRERQIQGYYLSKDLTLYEQPDFSSSIIFRDSTYDCSGYSELDGDGYLVRSQWNILEYTSNWVKVHYKNSIGWLNGKFFAANKIVVFDLHGNRFREFLSPFTSTGIHNIVAGNDSMSFYVSNHMDFYLKIDLFTGKVLDTVWASYLIDNNLLKKSYIHTNLNMPEEDFVLLDKMRFYPGTFIGRFLQERVIYIYKNTEFDNSLLSENYETGKIDTLFAFNRIQLGIAYQVESLCPLGNKYIVMSMNTYDARY